MSIFNYTEYKQFVRERVKQMPHRGRGQFRLMSLKLDVNSTVISQIFKGERHLSAEQGIKLAHFLGLSELETKYFINLILKERAGTEDLKNYFSKEGQHLKNQAKTLKARLAEHQEVTDQYKALFYSNWYYSGIRILSSLPKYNTVDDIAERLHLPRSVVAQVLDFLLATGLCVKKGEHLSVGPQNTHLDARSPLINNHRRNWHIKALERINVQDEADLFYSGPMSLSKEDSLLVREELVSHIAKILKRVQKSNEEEVKCLNIDWFGF
jgi:uncharacterized protein (TIGR02147 family)